MRTNVKEALAGLADKNGGKLRFRENLAKHSSINIGGLAGAWYEPRDKDELCKVIRILRDNGVRHCTLGKGTNVLLPDGDVDIVFINLAGKVFTDKTFDGLYVTAGAGEKLSALIKEAAIRDLAGLEGLIGIPGTVGGALFMNSGYLAEISDFLVRTKVIDEKGEIITLDKSDIKFRYRGSTFKKEWVIIEAVFKLYNGKKEDILKKIKANFDKKIRTQPLDEKTLGCVFKNPGKALFAGELIEKSGLKNLSVGDARISEKHANFIVNTGKATARDVLTLIEIIQHKVKSDFSVKLEPEIKIF